nr:MAG: hypothetical protein [Porcellio scaber clopovirus]
MVESSSNKAIVIMTDILILLTSFAPVFILELIVEPRQSGFFCNDSSIRYPYKEPMIPTSYLLSFFISFPMFIISILEFSKKFFDKTLKLSRCIYSLYTTLKVFSFGFGISTLTVEIFKISLGNLRPHFMDVCDPKNECLNSSSDNNYIISSDSICNPKIDYDLIKKARLSFMSAHASISAFSCFFLIFYLQFRIRIKKEHILIKPLVQYLCFILAVLVSLSRIVDHHHHWYDVLAGFLNGIIFAAFCCFAILKYGRSHSWTLNKAENLRLNNRRHNENEKLFI